jgi:hypothetical protein
MSNTTKEHKTQPAATRDNTVFLSVAAYKNYESVTAALRKSAADYGVPIVLCDIGESWRGFYHHKIETMSERLKHMRDDGKQFAFVLDSRDVVFIEPLDSILEKFNAINDGRVIFNQDVQGKIWPSHHDRLAQVIQESMESPYVRLNAGVYAGAIDSILEIQHLAIKLRRELKEGCPRAGMSAILYQSIGSRFTNDDQHLYQICLTYLPELFRVDNDKKLFAVLWSYPKNTREYSDDPKRHDVINNAAIIHSPWLSRKSGWNDWAFQNRWQR